MERWCLNSQRIPQPDIDTLHIKIKDMVHTKRYGSMDLQLELLLELLLLLLPPLLHVFITELGALSLKQRAKRWLAIGELDRGNLMGELEQPSAGRKR